MSLASLTRWKASTLIATAGRFVRMALANAADASMSTASIGSRDAAGRAANHVLTPFVVAAIDHAEDPGVWTWSDISCVVRAGF